MTTFWGDDFDPFTAGYKPSEEDKLTHYSLAFVSDGERVALLEKQRPAFLRGKWNGIGGKYELSDDSLEDTALRELTEEANLRLDASSLVKYAILAGEDYIIHVYAAKIIAIDLDDCWAQTDEDVNLVKLVDIDSYKLDRDAKYLLLMALLTLDGEPIQAVIKRSA